MKSQRPAFMHFFILNATVAISGFTQGMLLPLIAIIFEKDGIPSTVNGLHAASLYIGMLLAIPFMEAPLRRFGYKPFIMTGGLTIIVTLLAFSAWKSIWFWFILRLFIGIGNNVLHFGTQTWITSLSSARNRGRNISIYGLCFGLGYGFGPLSTHLLEINETLPFIISACLSLVVWLTLFLLKNEYPEAADTTENPSILQTFKQFRIVWKYAWVAFLFPFAYGFLEASVNSNFPVYALRIGIDVSTVSLLLPMFAVGTIVFQLPLGVLSDRFGRRNILTLVLPLGVVTFATAGVFQEYISVLMVCFFVAGMFVGSIFSLGLAYMVDLVPKNLLASGNLLATVLFSIGSITGPFIGGLTIQYVRSISFFYTISLMLLIVFLVLFLFKPDQKLLHANEV